MGIHPFTLTPFDGSPPVSDLCLNGTVQRTEDTLSIQFLLEGDLGALAIPAAVNPPSRREGLWESTCFEWFLALPAALPYWEFNLSPAGHWNVYRLAGYRLGLEPELAYGQLSCAVTRRPNRLRLDLDCPLPAQARQVPRLELAVCAVLESRSGGLSYWALHHPAPQPDFHRREGFLIRL